MSRFRPRLSFHRKGLSIREDCRRGKNCVRVGHEVPLGSHGHGFHIPHPARCRDRIPRMPLKYEEISQCKTSNDNNYSLSLNDYPPRRISRWGHRQRPVNNRKLRASLVKSFPSVYKFSWAVFSEPSVYDSIDFHSDTSIPNYLGFCCSATEAVDNLSNKCFTEEFDRAKSVEILSANKANKSDTDSYVGSPKSYLEDRRDVNAFLLENEISNIQSLADFFDEARKEHTDHIFPEGCFFDQEFIERDRTFYARDDQLLSMKQILQFLNCAAEKINEMIKFQIQENERIKEHTLLILALYSNATLKSSLYKEHGTSGSQWMYKRIIVIGDSRVHDICRGSAYNSTEGRVELFCKSDLSLYSLHDFVSEQISSSKHRILVIFSVGLPDVLRIIDQVGVLLSVELILQELRRLRKDFKEHFGDGYDFIFADFLPINAEQLYEKFGHSSDASIQLEFKKRLRLTTCRLAKFCYILSKNMMVENLSRHQHLPCWNIFCNPIEIKLEHERIVTPNLKDGLNPDISESYQFFGICDRVQELFKSYNKQIQTPKLDSPKQHVYFVCNRRYETMSQFWPVAALEDKPQFIFLPEVRSHSIFKFLDAICPLQENCILVIWFDILELFNQVRLQDCHNHDPLVLPIPNFLSSSQLYDRLIAIRKEIEIICNSPYVILATLCPINYELLVNGVCTAHTEHIDSVPSNLLKTVTEYHVSVVDRVNLYLSQSNRMRGFPAWDICSHLYKRNESGKLEIIPDVSPCDQSALKPTTVAKLLMSIGMFADDTRKCVNWLKYHSYRLKTKSEKNALREDLPIKKHRLLIANERSIYESRKAMIVTPLRSNFTSSAESHNSNESASEIDFSQSELASSYHYNEVQFCDTFLGTSFCSEQNCPSFTNNYFIDLSNLVIPPPPSNEEMAAMLAADVTVINPCNCDSNVMLMSSTAASSHECLLSNSREHRESSSDLIATNHNVNDNQKEDLTQHESSEAEPSKSVALRKGSLENETASFSQSSSATFDVDMVLAEKLIDSLRSAHDEEVNRLRSNHEKHSKYHQQRKEFFDQALANCAGREINFDSIERVWQLFWKIQLEKCFKNTWKKRVQQLVAMLSGGKPLSSQTSSLLYRYAKIELCDNNASLESASSQCYDAGKELPNLRAANNTAYMLGEQLLDHVKADWRNIGFRKSLEMLRNAMEKIREYTNDTSIKLDDRALFLNLGVKLKSFNDYLETKNENPFDLNYLSIAEITENFSTAQMAEYVAMVLSTKGITRPDAEDLETICKAILALQKSRARCD